MALLSENGRNGGESSRSSSASERACNVALDDLNRGRRAYARLRDRGASASDEDPDDDKESESGTFAGGVLGRSKVACFCFGEASKDFRWASLLLSRF